jgi:hypothetical protein
VSFLPDFHQDDGFLLEGGQGYLVLADQDTSLSVAGTGWNGASGSAVLSSKELGGGSRKGKSYFVVAGNLTSSEPVELVARIQRTGVNARGHLSSIRGEFGLAFLDVQNSLEIFAGDIIEVDAFKVGQDVAFLSSEVVVDDNDLERGFCHAFEGEGGFHNPVPKATSLSRAYPNPFNPITKIQYQLAKPGRVELKIFDLRGRLVKTLVNEKKDPGFYEVIWEGRDQKDRGVASGVYFLKMKAKGYSHTDKLVLIK